MERLLTLGEVSARTGIPEATLRFWRHKGIGPTSARIGRRIKYREADVQAWFDQQFEQDKSA